MLSEDGLENLSKFWMTKWLTFGQDGREYTLLLKLKGAESGSSYQVRWVPVKQSSFEAPFNKFSAYRRGRPDPEAPPLDPSEIEILAIQIASNFTQQSGNFQLDLKSINGLADGQASEIWIYHALEIDEPGMAGMDLKDSNSEGPLGSHSLSAKANKSDSVFQQPAALFVLDTFDFSWYLNIYTRA